MKKTSLRGGRKTSVEIQFHFKGHPVALLRDPTMCLYTFNVIPAEAGIQSNIKLVPRFRGGNNLFHFWIPWSSHGMTTSLV